MEDGLKNLTTPPLFFHGFAPETVHTKLHFQLVMQLNNQINQGVIKLYERGEDKVCLHSSIYDVLGECGASLYYFIKNKQYFKNTPYLLYRKKLS